MVVKQIIDEDFINYKSPSMLIAFPICSWKCNSEYGEIICHNISLENSPNIDISIDRIIKRYMDNSITSSIIFGGLEPLDSFEDAVKLIENFRFYIMDDIVIYTGYYENEIKNKIEQLKKYKNIIIKFGRYIPNKKPHFDEVLGVELASDNQFARRIS